MSCGRSRADVTRVPEACAFTAQHGDPDAAQVNGMPSDYSFGMPNGGLQVVNPSQATYDLIVAQLAKDATSGYEFADQSLLSDLFRGRWVALPYVYNALKTLRWKGVHDAIWRDDRVKNIHYILAPKPWEDGGGDETHPWWTKMDRDRKEAEQAQGSYDGH